MRINEWKSEPAVDKPGDHGVSGTYGIDYISAGGLAREQSAVLAKKHGTLAVEGYICSLY